MNRKYHIGLSVRGALKNGEWRKSLVGACADDGRVMTADEIFTRLCDELARGHEMISYSQCDNWDWKDGCLGHDSPAANGEEGGS